MIAKIDFNLESDGICLVSTQKPMVGLLPLPKGTLTRLPLEIELKSSVGMRYEKGFRKGRSNTMSATKTKSSWTEMSMLNKYSKRQSY